MKKKKILVFIPAYKCAPQIGRVLKQFDRAMQELVDTILIVDNRSPDMTQAAAIEAAKGMECQVLVWENAGNYGLGGSHKVAFQYADERDFEYVVVLHGDDQGNISDALSVLKSTSTDPDWDCMLGARFHPNSKISGYSKFRTFGNIVYDWIFSAATGRRIYDLGSGLNVYKLKSLDTDSLKFLPDDLTFNYGMLLSSLSKRQVVKFFPISWREDDQVSNVKLFSQAFKVLKILWIYLNSRRTFPAQDLRSTSVSDYTGRIIFDNSREPVKPLLK
ncbi:MAG: glycosyltransferase family 2 protein [Proteobacteria bacterium]|nr:MAG: glycosyltransferase family 2 protein [Pseudomonadota bacterium]